MGSMRVARHAGIQQATAAVAATSATARPIGADGDRQNRDEGGRGGAAHQAEPMADV